MSRYLISLLKAPFSTVRYLILTPPFLRRQIVHDRRTRELIFFKSRNHIDYGTINQVYVQQEYDISHTRRFKELRDFFQGTMRMNRKPLVLDCGANIGIASHYL